MQLITTTQLRTRSKELVETLLAGRSVNLIHRSKIIAELRPKESEPKVFTAKDAEKIRAIARKLNLPKLSDKEMDRRYRAAMMKKHGQYLSGHK
jgi:hypothetical protein